MGLSGTGAAGGSCIAAVPLELASWLLLAGTLSFEAASAAAALRFFLCSFAFLRSASSFWRRSSSAATRQTALLMPRGHGRAIQYGICRTQKGLSCL